MSNHAHVRFTPLDLSGYDISEFCKGFEKYIVAVEKGAPGAGQQSEHYHIYLETNVTKKTVDNRIHKYLNVPSSGGRGKNSKYFSNKYNEYTFPSPEYIVKDGKIVEYQGYTQEQIDKYETFGRAKYGHKNVDVDLNSGELCVQPPQQNTPAPKRESEWDKLLDWYEEQPNYQQMDMVQIRKMIMTYYLKQRKPIPRSGDLGRYTYSLWALGHQKEDSIETCDAQAALDGIKV